jgi:hypothetical protein
MASSAPAPKAVREYKTERLARLLKDYAEVNIQQVYEHGFIREELEQFAIAQGLMGSKADKWWKDDAIGGAIDLLKRLGVLTKNPHNTHFQVTISGSLPLSKANTMAIQLLQAGKSQQEIFQHYRTYAENADPSIGTIYRELKKRDTHWRKVNKKLATTPDDTPTMKRAGWVRGAASDSLGSVCQITADPMYVMVDGKQLDNGVDSSHIVPLETLKRWGFKHFDSPHCIRLLRVDYHRRNDSGVSLVKDNPNLKVIPEFADSHAKADVLRDLLDLLTAVEG